MHAVYKFIHIAMALDHYPWKVVESKQSFKGKFILRTSDFSKSTRGYCNSLIYLL